MEVLNSKKNWWIACIRHVSFGFTALVIIWHISVEIVPISTLRPGASQQAGFAVKHCPPLRMNTSRSVGIEILDI